MKLCMKWDSTFYVKLIASIGPLIITVINVILRVILVVLIKWIGFNSHSKETRAIKNGTFITIFFNTVIMILFVNADFSDI